jgi:hypothetical protein
MQNLDVPNGAMMVVTRLEQDVVWVMTNSRNGVVEMPIIPTVFDYDNGNGFKFSRTQLPLRIAFAVTIHRSQGGTYDVVGYHGGRPVFYHGGLFVAFTRCTTAEGFSVFVKSPSDYPRPTVRNVVHPRVSTDTGLGFYCACGCNPFPPGYPGPPPPPPPPPPAGDVVDEEDVDEDVPFNDYVRPTKR